MIDLMENMVNIEFSQSYSINALERCLIGKSHEKDEEVDAYIKLLNDNPYLRPRHAMVEPLERP